MLKALREYLKRLRDQRALEGMSDQELRDIGIDRHDIHSAVWRGK